jgi:hypothetical protein
LTSKFSRLALIATCAIGFSGLVAAPAFATISPPSVQKTTKITPESAVINGLVDTGGLSTTYVFEYDTLSDFKAGGNNAMYAPTPPLDIPAGATAPVPVSVPIGCYPSLTCPIDQTPLDPNTTYVVYLQSQPGTAAGTYYQTVSLNSAAGTFKTLPIGKTSLLSTKIAVSSGKAHVDLKCTGVEKCKGVYTVTARKKGKTLTCSTGKYTVGPGDVSTVKAKLKGSCLSLIAKQTSLSYSGKLSLVSTVDQATIKKNVTLSLSS